MMVLMRLAAAVVAALFVATLASAEPSERAPEGYSLVAEDDCGGIDGAPHVVRGQDFSFATGAVTGAREARDIIFDNDFCLLRYEGLVPDAPYKVDVVYVTEAAAAGAREQSLEANGHVVHEPMRLPSGTPGRFVFDIPPAAYADGQPLELKFFRVGGANAVVSCVRLWSTNPKPLPAQGALWTPAGSVERDWRRQDRLRGGPDFSSDGFGEGVRPAIEEQLARARAILQDLTDTGVAGLDDETAALAEADRGIAALIEREETDPAAWLDAYRSARWAARRLVFRHPALGGERLLFVRRHHAHTMHQCARRLGSFTLPGGGICVLDGISADGVPEVTDLTDGLFPPATFGRPDVSFDGTRLVFGYAREREGDGSRLDYGGISEYTAPLYAAHETGPCREFQVFEMALDGTPPRQLTRGPSENSDPLYLPDGRIAFMSHRPGGLVQCGDWALAYCVFTMGPDGSDVRQVTVSKDGEWDLFLLDDGTIGFTRWEYVMKFWSPIQMLWSVRPDGTDSRMIYGSDLSREYAYPLNYASARQIPGTSKLVCIGSAHHNTGAGPVCVVDLALGPAVAEGLERITPVRYVETSDQQPDNGWYDCPYPLDENYFLVSYSFSQSETDTTGYGIYVLDAYGGKELIYRDPELSALFPMPLGPRPRPGELPELTDPEGDGYGEVVIQNVHAGLPADAAGEARYVRVVECHERQIHTSPYDLQVGPDSGFETKTVLGTVPVAPDGSAHFRLPAGKSVYFSVLDADYRALHTMRSVTNVQPGERVSCIGCHEGYRLAPANEPPLAVATQPVHIEPPPWGVVPMAYAAVVQPVLDRHCVSCHDASPDAAAPNLMGDAQSAHMGVAIPVSYSALRPYVRHAPIFSYALQPGSFGSRVSPLMDLLAAGHHGVELDADSWRRLCAWIDCNAPAIGDYRDADVALRDERSRAERERVAARRKVTDERRNALAAALPEGQRLVLYLDCGVVATDGEAGGLQIREVIGNPYVYGADAGIAAPWYDDISFGGSEVAFELTGLDPASRYSLGFSWWDHNDAGRAESVTAQLDGGATIRLLDTTPLPAWANKQEKPRDIVIPLPPDATRAGRLRLSFTNDSPTGNAVVSEVWLMAHGLRG